MGVQEGFLLIENVSDLACDLMQQRHTLRREKQSQRQGLQLHLPELLMATAGILLLAKHPHFLLP